MPSANVINQVGPAYPGRVNTRTKADRVDSAQTGRFEPSRFDHCGSICSVRMDQFGLIELTWFDPIHGLGLVRFMSQVWFDLGTI